MESLSLALCYRILYGNEIFFRSRSPGVEYLRLHLLTLPREIASGPELTRLDVTPHATRVCRLSKVEKQFLLQPFGSEFPQRGP